MTARCLHCGDACRMTTGAQVYPHRPDLYQKIIYVCDPCGARVGCHPGTETALGKAVNETTRKARMKVHAMIDPFWKARTSRSVARRTVYRFMQEKFGMTDAECHVGCFDEETCERVLRGMQNVTQLDLQRWQSRNPDSRKKKKRREAA